MESSRQQKALGTQDKLPIMKFKRQVPRIMAPNAPNGTILYAKHQYLFNSINVVPSYPVSLPPSN
jgi:hypothetical protein